MGLFELVLPSVGPAPSQFKQFVIHSYWVHVHTYNIYQFSIFILHKQISELV